MYFSKSHEWVKIEGNIATIGITDFAQMQLGDIVFIDCGKSGKNLNKMGVIGAIESVKAASDIYTPVSGEIIETNESLKNDPGIVNKSSQTDGWICDIPQGLPCGFPSS